MLQFSETEVKDLFMAVCTANAETDEKLRVLLTTKRKSKKRDSMEKHYRSMLSSWKPLEDKLRQEIWRFTQK